MVRRSPVSETWKRGEGASETERKLGGAKPLSKARSAPTRGLSRGPRARCFSPRESDCEGGRRWGHGDTHGTGPHRGGLSSLTVGIRARRGLRTDCLNPKSSLGGCSLGARGVAFTPCVSLAVAPGRGTILPHSGLQDAGKGVFLARKPFGEQDQKTPFSQETPRRAHRG